MFANISFQIFAWIANLFYSFEIIGTKLLSKYEINNPWLLNFFYSGLVLVFMAPLALYSHAGWPVEWGNLLLAGLCWSLGSVGYILALFELDITTLSPLFNLRIAFTVVLGVLLLAEKLTLAQAGFIILIFLGSVLITMDEKASYGLLFKKKVLLIVLIMTLAFTFEAVFIKKAIAVNGYWTTTLWVFVISQLLFCFTLPKFASEIAKVSRKQIWIVILIAALDLCGVLANNKAYEKNISISSAILNIPISAILAFILSLIAPRFLEKHTNKVYAARFIGIALIVWAGIKLS